MRVCNSIQKIIDDIWITITHEMYWIDIFLCPVYVISFYLPLFSNTFVFLIFSLCVCQYILFLFKKLKKACRTIKGGNKRREEKKRWISNCILVFVLLLFQCLCDMIWHFRIKVQMRRFFYLKSFFLFSSAFLFYVSDGNENKNEQTNKWTNQSRIHCVLNILF